MNVKVYFTGKDYFGRLNGFQSCEADCQPFKTVQKVVRDIKDTAKRIDTFEIRPNGDWQYPVVQVTRTYRDIASPRALYEVICWETAVDNRLVKWDSRNATYKIAIMTFEGMKAYVYDFAKKLG